MLSLEDTKRYSIGNQYQKSDKTPFVTYPDLGSLIGKMNGFRNNLEKLYTTKVGEHIPSAVSMSTISLFKDKK